MYRDGILAILHRKGKYLCVHKPDRPADEWLFPGGGIEDGESPRDTFYREMQEELGLTADDMEDVTVTDIVHQYDWPEEPQKYASFDGAAKHVITAELQGDVDIVLGDELDRYRFVSADDLVGELPFDDLRETVEQLADLGHVRLP